MMNENNHTARDKWVRRDEALGYCRLSTGDDCRILLVQARAGQGKTTLAEQFAEEFGGPVCWCDCSEADTDHVALLEKLCSSLSESLRAFDPAATLQAVQSSFTVEESLEVVAGNLASTFHSESIPKTLMVIDDAHLLLDSPNSLKMLRAFADGIPGTITLAVLTREALLVDGAPLFSYYKTIRIDDSLLAFSGAEIAVLHERIFNRTVSDQECATILLATEGWAAGVLLSGGTNGNRIPTNGSLADYFRTTCLNGISEQARTDILCMALLDEFPTTMAVPLDVSQGAAFAERLAAKNLFVRVVERRGGLVYRFHHLFRDALRNMIAEEMSRKAQVRFLIKAARKYAAHGFVERGLTCLASANEWTMLAAMLRSHGMALINANHLETMRKVLLACPDERLRSDGWFMLFLGRVLLTEDPVSALKLLSAAHRFFLEQSDDKGELLAIIFQIYTHLFITGNLRAFVPMLPRARAVFAVLEDNLDPQTVMLCAYILGLGYCYALSDVELADEYSTLAVEAAGKSGYDAPPPEVMLATYYSNGLTGEVSRSLDALEPFFSKLRSPNLCPSTRVNLWVVYLNFLLMKGDLDGYRRSRLEVESVFSSILANSHLGGFLRIWDADVQMACGNMEEVLVIANGILDHVVFSKIGHIVSQAHQYLALANAHLGNKDEAMHHARLSSRTRARIGGWFFKRLNHAVVGMTLVLCGDHRRAERALNHCMKNSSRFKSYYLGPQVRAYRACLRLSQDRTTEALIDIDVMIGELIEQGNTHFFYRDPKTLRMLLNEAMVNNVRTDDAEYLMDKWFSADTRPRREIALTRAKAGLESHEQGKPWSAHLHFSAMADILPARLDASDAQGTETVNSGLAAWIALLMDSNRHQTASRAVSVALRLFPMDRDFLKASRTLRSSRQQ